MLKEESNNTKLEIIKKVLTITRLDRSFVILKKDDNGYYIEYAFCEGAPHDNRCLSWYDSYQPRRIESACEGMSRDEIQKELAYRKARVEEKCGKIFKLGSFTCGYEEEPIYTTHFENMKWRELFQDKPFIMQDHICMVGSPAKACREIQASDWTYDEPCKCACWHLLHEIDIEHDDSTFMQWINYCVHWHLLHEIDIDSTFINYCQRSSDNHNIQAL